MWRDFCQYTDETTALWLVKYHRYNIASKDLTFGNGAGHTGMPPSPTKAQFNRFIKDDREYLLSFPPMNVDSDYSNFQWDAMYGKRGMKLFDFSTKANREIEVKGHFGSHKIQGVRSKDIEQHINELIELNKEA